MRRRGSRRMTSSLSSWGGSRTTHRERGAGSIDGQRVAPVVHVRCGIEEVFAALVGDAVSACGALVAVDGQRALLVAGVELEVEHVARGLDADEVTDPGDAL